MTNSLEKVIICCILMLEFCSSSSSILGYVPGRQPGIVDGCRCDFHVCIRSRMPGIDVVVFM